MSCRIFCFAPYAGYFAVHHQLDAVIALAMRNKGAATMLMGCSGLYKDCEAIVHTPQHKKRIECDLCASKGAGLLTLGGLQMVSINDLVTNPEIQQVEAWSQTLQPEQYAELRFKQYPLGIWSLSSLLTTFQISIKELARPELVPFFHNLLRNAALTAIAIERVLEHFQPTVGLVFNGRFAQYRTAFEILRGAGLRVVTHERGFSDNSFFFYNNATFSDPAEFVEVARPWAQVALCTPQLERVQQYIAAREYGKDLNIPAMYTYSTDELAVRAMLGVGRECLFGFFTSTETEMAQSEHVGLANTQLPLLRAAIEYFRSRQQASSAASEAMGLIIRHHPNLAGDAMHPAEYAFITEIYRVLIDAPRCVRSIMPTEELSTYALLWHLHGAVIPFSSVGTEIGSRGACSIASQRTSLHMGQALSFDRWQEVDFAQVVPALVALSRELPLDVLRRNYRFVYTFIERGSVRFNSVGIRDHYQPNISAEVVQDIISDRDPNLKRIAEGLLHNRSVYPEPSAEDLTRGQDDEDAFLGAQRAAILQRKASILKEASLLEGDLSPVILLAPQQRASPYPLVFGERYPAILNSEFAWDLNEEQVLAKLCDLLERSQATYALISHPQGSFDGCFVNEGVSFLAANSAPTMLLRGVWLGDRAGALNAEFLSKVKPAHDRAALQRSFPNEQQVLRFLSFGFYRRAFLLDFLQSLLRCPNSEARLDQLLALWASPVCMVKARQCGLALL